MKPESIHLNTQNLSLIISDNDDETASVLLAVAETLNQQVEEKDIKLIKED
jgi:hypothetical protein